MLPLPLHDFHAAHGAHFGALAESEVVEHYGDSRAEHAALQQSAAPLDLSFRGRLVLAGEDRVRFLNGQITNNVKDLPEGAGCYAALVTNKGKMQSDLNVYVLPGEVLLDFEPGLSTAVQQRLESYIVADDVQVIDAAPHYGLLSVQGPRAWEVVAGTGLDMTQPGQSFGINKAADAALGEIYCARQPRLGTTGYDLFAPLASLQVLAEKLSSAAKHIGAGWAGWRAFETARIEAGVPRFGAEMDATNLPPEAGIESRAISYTKGCYIGQEIIARIRTYGQVAKALRPLFFESAGELPQRGEKLFLGDKEVGYVTSAIHSPTFQKAIGFGYVRRECNAPGTELSTRGPSPMKACIVRMPGWS
jgi:folate-binding protein YgfZ